MLVDATHGSRPEDDEAARRSAQAQALFREVNEQIHQLAQHGGAAQDRCRIVCECADSDCVKSIELPQASYVAVRRFPTRFIVARGHHTEGVERVVEDADGYVVVEKVGAGATTALRLDPRGRRSRRS